ncbi:hypothetical protein EYC45_14835 [Pseudoxanthomonas winnipegensis]|nr:hypothetical protein EYC45_14835 [Pseudoxanthomonas winnipegensis]
MAHCDGWNRRRAYAGLCVFCMVRGGRYSLLSPPRGPAQFGEGSFFGKRCRLDILLLINAPVGFVPSLAGLGCEATGIDQWRYPAKRRGKLY